MEVEGFQNIVQQGWHSPYQQQHKAKSITTKLKQFKESSQELASQLVQPKDHYCKHKAYHHVPRNARGIQGPKLGRVEF